MPLELWSPDRLRPYVRNPRTHSAAQIGQIARSIQEFGFTNPILVARDGTVVAGHGRLLAAQRLGLDEVPVIVLGHLTETQRRALVIADNRLALDAGWDEALLAEELKALRAEEFDLEIVGFSDEELAALLAEPEGGEEAEEDATPERPSTPTTAPGDLWLLGDHRVLCGDSTDVDQVERALGDRLADMMFTYPPYGVAYQSHMADGGTASRFAPIENDSLNPSELERFLSSCFSCAAIGLRNGAAVYVCHADQKAGIRPAFERALLAAEFCLGGCIVWVKPSGTMGWQDYRNQYEPILYGWRTGADRRHIEDRTETTVWAIGKDAPISYQHPTQKPVELPARAIRNSTLAGETVLDLFGGSGSTLIAAAQQARRAVLVEKDPGYTDVIVTRWQTFAGKEARLEGDGRTFAEVKAERNP